MRSGRPATTAAPSPDQVRSIAPCLRSLVGGGVRGADACSLLLSPQMGRRTDHTAARACAAVASFRTRRRRRGALRQSSKLHCLRHRCHLRRAGSAERGTRCCSLTPRTRAGTRRSGASTGSARRATQRPCATTSCSGRIMSGRDVREEAASMCGGHVCGSGEARGNSAHER